MKLKKINIENTSIRTAPIDYVVTDGNGNFDFSQVDLGFGKGDGIGFVLVVWKRGYEENSRQLSLGDGPKALDAFVLNEIAKK